MRRREIDQSAGDHMAVIADETGDAPDDEQQNDAGYPQLHQLLLRHARGPWQRVEADRLARIPETDQRE